MIRQALVVRLDGRVGSGRNQPLRVAVETHDGLEHEAILKPSGRGEMTVEAMMNETLAGALALDLNLPVNPAYIAELTPEFLDSIPDAELKRELGNANKWAFASHSSGAGWSVMPSMPRVSEDLREAALPILAFDAFTENDDRKPRNPNLMTNGESVKIIDHDSSFGTRMRLFPPPRPWEVGNLARLQQPDGHVLFGVLRGAQTLDFDAVKASWAGLTDEQIDAYLDLLPQAWNSIRPAAEDAVAHIKAVRDRIDDCITELRRILQ